MYCIIDGDSLVYKAAGAAQHRNPDSKELEYEPVVNAYSNAKNMMLKILEKTGCTDYRLILTASHDTTCFRTALYPEYKANRKKTERPKYYQEVRDYYIQNWDAEVVETIEADDAVCILQHYWYNDDFDSSINNWGSNIELMLAIQRDVFPAVLCGIDKDLDQIPGLHYNYSKQEFYYITPIEGLRKFYFQILTGDKSDNIPRIQKGWRQAEAEEDFKWLSTEKQLYQRVVQEYMKVYNISLQKAQYEIQWRSDLLYLKRHVDDKYTLPIEEPNNV